MKATFLFEFFSRGLLWSRLLLVALLVPDDSYALIALLVTAEALIGGVISFPQIREVLVSKRLVGDGVWTGGALWCLTLPLQYVGTWLYFKSHAAAVTVATCSLAFMVSSIMIYMLRVESVRDHNIAKSLSAVSSSILFFILIPLNPYLYIIPAVISPIAPAVFLARRKGWHFFAPKMPEWSNARGGWLTFGLQGLAAVFWQYGNRFIVGYLFAAATLSGFIRGYLLASGVTFIYSAVMIVWERSISVEVDDSQLKNRIALALRVFGMLAAFWIIYSIFTYFVFVKSIVQISLITDLSRGLDPLLFFIFSFVFLIRAIQLALSPVVIAVGGRAIVTLASISSLAVQVCLFVLLWSVLTPVMVALIMAASLLISVIIPGLWLCSKKLALG